MSGTSANGSFRPAPEPLAPEFAPADYVQWEALVRAAEKDPDRRLTATLEEGIEVKWLYASGDVPSPDPGGLPGADPFVRGERIGTPWAIRQRCAAPTRRRANAEIHEDLEGGATEVLLAVGEDRIPVADVEQLAEVLEGVYLDLAPVALETGPGGLVLARTLAELWRRSGVPAAELRGSLRLDPIGTAAVRGGARDDGLAGETAAAVGLLAELRAEFPLVQTLAVDTGPYVEAGAGATLELALALATGIYYLRAGEAAGIDPAELAGGLEFTLVAGPDQFLEIAKLRAARRLWATVLEHCGVAAERRRSPVYVRTSRRMESSLDPWINLLRCTTAAFAAAVGGAEGITVLPFDEPVGEATGPPGPLGRRMARNTQLVLLEEASLQRVADPAGGSWYVESLTDQLARVAWSALQELERTGGIAVALSSGEVARRVAAERTERHDQLAHRRRTLTGVNMFPLLGEDGVDRPDPPADAGGGGGDVRARPAGDAPAPLPPVRDAARFEALRARATRIAAARGREPEILLACMGPLSAHVNIAQWAKSFFEAGGVVTIASGEQPDDDAQAELLVRHGLVAAAVCPGRGAEPRAQASLVAALRAAGAQTVYLAGADSDEAQAAGADAGVRDGVDMVAVLGDLLDRLETGGQIGPPGTEGGGDEPARP